MSVVSVVCCLVKVSVSALSLVQRSPTEGGVAECDREASISEGPGTPQDVTPWRRNAGGGGMGWGTATMTLFQGIIKTNNQYQFSSAHTFEFNCFHPVVYM